MLEERAREKNQYGREFQKQMQLMQKEHKKEIDVSHLSYKTKIRPKK